jgi:hypothetical protein
MTNPLGGPLDATAIKTQLNIRLGNRRTVQQFTDSLSSLPSPSLSVGNIMAVIPDNTLVGSVTSATDNTTPYKITVELPQSIMSPTPPLSSDFSGVAANEFMLMGYDGLSANKEAYTSPITTSPTGYDIDSMRVSMAKNLRNAQYLSLIAAFGVREGEPKIPVEIDYMANTLISNNESVIVTPVSENTCLESGTFYMAQYLLDTPDGSFMTLTEYLSYISRPLTDFTVSLSGPTITDNTRRIRYNGDANNYFYMPPIDTDSNKIIVVALANSDIAAIKTREADEQAFADRSTDHCIDQYRANTITNPGIPSCPNGQSLTRTPDKLNNTWPAGETFESYCCEVLPCDCSNEPTPADLTAFNAANPFDQSNLTQNSLTWSVQDGGCGELRNDYRNLFSSQQAEESIFRNMGPVENSLLSRCCDINLYDKVSHPEFLQGGNCGGH